MSSGRLEDGTPVTLIGNSEPIPEWMLDRTDLSDLLTMIREDRRRAGWCDHGYRLLGAPILPRGHERARCPEGCE